MCDLVDSLLNALTALFRIVVRSIESPRCQLLTLYIRTSIFCCRPIRVFKLQFNVLLASRNCNSVK